MKSLGARVRPLVFAAGIALCLGASPDAARNAQPPPSPKFAARMPLLFADEFRTERLDRWRVDRDGVWSVRRGMLKAELPDAKQDHSLIFTGDSTWTDYAVDLDVCGMRGVDKGLVVRVRGSRGLGIDLRGPGYQDVRVNVNEFPVAKVSIENGNAVWHHVRAEIRGRNCVLFVDGQKLVERKVSKHLPESGGIALAAYTGGIGQCTVYYDNVIVTPLGKPAGTTSGMSMP